MNKATIIKKIFVVILTATIGFSSSVQTAIAAKKTIKVKIKKSIILGKGLEQAKKEAAEKAIEQDFSSPAIVKGIVTDGTNQNAPLSAVEVKIGGLSAVTDANGSYQITNLQAPANYSINVAKGGYIQQIDSIDIRKGKSHIKNFVLIMNRLTGIIKDSDGAFISGVAVSISGNNDTRTTGNSGKYDFLGVALGSVQLTVTKTGYFSQTKEVNATTGGTHVTDFVLERSDVARCEGIVTDTNNGDAGLGGVRVGLNGTNQFVMTGADGRYSLPNIPIGNKTIETSKEGYSSMAQQFVTTQGGPQTLNFSLRRQAMVSGNILDAANNNAPLSGVQVTCRGQNVTTDSQGRYTISRLLTGSTNVRVMKNSYTTQTRDVTLQAGENSADFVLERSDVARCEGIVTDSNNGDAGLGGVRVGLNGTNQYVTTGDDGRYSLPNIPIGNKTIEASKEGYSSMAQQFVTTQGGPQTLNFSMRQAIANIKGDVMLDSGKNKIPVANATIKYEGPKSGKTITDTDGKYIINGLILGTYTLHVTASSVGSSNNKSVTLGRQGETVTVQILMEDSEEEIEIEVEQ